MTRCIECRIGKGEQESLMAPIVISKWYSHRTHELECSNSLSESKTLLHLCLSYFTHNEFNVSNEIASTTFNLDLPDLSCNDKIYFCYNHEWFRHLSVLPGVEEEEWRKYCRHWLQFGELYCTLGWSICFPMFSHSHIREWLTEVTRLSEARNKHLRQNSWWLFACAKWLICSLAQCGSFEFSANKPCLTLGLESKYDFDDRQNASCLARDVYQGFCIDRFYKTAVLYFLRTSEQFELSHKQINFLKARNCYCRCMSEKNHKLHYAQSQECIATVAVKESLDPELDGKASAFQKVTSMSKRNIQQKDSLPNRALMKSVGFALSNFRSKTTDQLDMIIVLEEASKRIAQIWNVLANIDTKFIPIDDDELLLCKFQMYEQCFILKYIKYMNLNDYPGLSKVIYDEIERMCLASDETPPPKKNIHNKNKIVSDGFFNHASGATNSEFKENVTNGSDTKTNGILLDSYSSTDIEASDILGSSAGHSISGKNVLFPKSNFGRFGNVMSMPSVSSNPTENGKCDTITAHFLKAINSAFGIIFFCFYELVLYLMAFFMLKIWFSDITERKLLSNDTEELHANETLSSDIVDASAVVSRSNITFQTSNIREDCACFCSVPTSKDKLFCVCFQDGGKLITSTVLVNERAALGENDSAIMQMGENWRLPRLTESLQNLLQYPRDDFCNESIEGWKVLRENVLESNMYRAPFVLGFKNSTVTWPNRTKTLSCQVFTSPINFSQSDIRELDESWRDSGTRRNADVVDEDGSEDLRIDFRLLDNALWSPFTLPVSEWALKNNIKHAVCDYFASSRYAVWDASSLSESECEDTEVRENFSGEKRQASKSKIYLENGDSEYCGISTDEWSSEDHVSSSEQHNSKSEIFVTNFKDRAQNFEKHVLCTNNHSLNIDDHFSVQENHSFSLENLVTASIYSPVSLADNCNCPGDELSETFSEVFRSNADVSKSFGDVHHLKETVCIEHNDAKTGRPISCVERTEKSLHVNNVDDCEESEVSSRVVNLDTTEKIEYSIEKQKLSNVADFPVEPEVYSDNTASGTKVLDDLNCSKVIFIDGAPVRVPICANKKRTRKNKKTNRSRQEGHLRSKILADETPNFLNYIKIDNQEATESTGLSEVNSVITELKNDDVDTLPENASDNSKVSDSIMKYSENTTNNKAACAELFLDSATNCTGHLTNNADNYSELYPDFEICQDNGINYNEEIDDDKYVSVYQEEDNYTSQSRVFERMPGPYVCWKHAPRHLKSKLHKFYARRYSLFSRYDAGIRLDEESWFSVTPEAVAMHHAYRCYMAAEKRLLNYRHRPPLSTVAIDGFCGAGGNTIQLADWFDYVIAIDLDAEKLDCARNNAVVYGVEHKIRFIHGDFLTVMKDLMKGDSELVPFATYSYGLNLSSACTFIADCVFLSPPWGGVKYNSRTREFDVLEMAGCIDTREVMRCAFSAAPNVALYIPKTSNLTQVMYLTSIQHEVQKEKFSSDITDKMTVADSPFPVYLDIEANFYNSQQCSLTAYFGEDIVKLGTNEALDTTMTH